MFSWAPTLELLSKNVFYIFVEELVLQMKEEFHSHWMKSGRKKLVPTSDCGRAPAWWFYINEQTILCLH